MNTNIRNRLLSITCAAVMLSGNAPGMIPALHAAAQQSIVPDKATLQNSEPVTVVVTLNGDAALECVDDPDELSSSEAQSASARAERQQARVISKLREQYPALETGEQFTTLINGFSCTIPENLIPYAESLPGVTSVTVSRPIEIEPELADAAALGDIPAYYDETGCKGEGQVIAVIDTELNLDHPMFAPLPDDVNVKLTKEDVDAIANSVGFNCQDNWRNGYYNSKIPYAVDYCETAISSPFDVGNDSNEWYHGSHVAGIAAGNAFETDDGKVISGIAPNAQLIFMAVDKALYMERFIASIEDAVKLKADVLNISFGMSAEAFDMLQPMTDAINAAEAAGVTVCISAGNDSNGSAIYRDTRYADDPDRSLLNGFITEGEKALAVAAADNSYTLEMHTLTHDGTLIAYTGCSPAATAEELYLGDVLGNASYEYEYCGLGYQEDFADKDLTGKIALVDRGILDFTVKANNAKAAGAVGVIVVQNQPFDYILMRSDSDLLLALISQEDGQMLKDAAVKTVCFTEERITQTIPTKVSSYTSWGVHNSLELRPDIMGVGTNVESANNTGSGTSVMSGTSMASPYIAGCAALLNEYLDKNGCTLTGSDRQQRIRNLMMTAAVPYSEDGMFVMPRRQGAGLVSVNRAIHNKVLITGAEGESKLSLRDSLGSQFSFPVTLTNISDEDVAFSSARIELTTDGTEYDAEANQYLLTTGQQTLSCTADLSELTEIAAGSAKTVSVTVTLDAAQAASLDAIFTNGYFIEGYLLLEGAENCCDISVPLLGFSKCFTDMSIFGDDCTSVSNFAWGIQRFAAESFYDMVKLSQSLDYPTNPDLENLSDEEAAEQLMQYLQALEKTEADLRKIDTIYISPNHSYLAENPGFILDIIHDCLISGAELLDQEGRIAARGYDEVNMVRSQFSSYDTAVFPSEPLYDLPEGAYTLRVSAGMTKDMLHNYPQTIETKVIIDKTAPELQSEVTEQNGRKILKITAADEYLDHIVVLGKGSGALVDPERYDKLDGTGKDPVKDYIRNSIAEVYDFFTYSVDEGSDRYPLWGSDPEQDKLLEESSPFLDMFYGYNVDCEDEEETGMLGLYDYGEVIKAKPDKMGTFTMEYDITDLSMYNITVFDNAFNSAYVDYVPECDLPDAVPSGIYISLHGLYEFTADTVRFYPFAYGGKPTTYHYYFDRASALEPELILVGDFEDSLFKESSPFEFEFPSDTELILYKPLFEYHFGIPDTSEERLTLTDLTSAEDFFAIDTYTLENDYILPFMKEYTGRGAVKIIDYELAPDAVVTYICLCNDIGGGHVANVSVTVDLKTGIATTEDGSTVDILHTALIAPGDLNEDSTVDVADAVMLARLLTEDAEVRVTAQGRKNADCNRNGQLDQQDVVLILKAIARLVNL